MQDVNCDANAVVKEFADYYYGAAGALMRTYIRELEKGRKEMDAPPGVTYNSKSFDDQTFPYLTASNIYRWQQCFDRMEALTAEQPKHLLHVQTVRRKLDFATLWKWLDLAQKCPQYFKDYKTIAKRIRAANTAVLVLGPKLGYTRRAWRTAARARSGEHVGGLRVDEVRRANVWRHCEEGPSPRGPRHPGFREREPVQMSRTADVARRFGAPFEVGLDHRDRAPCIRRDGCVYGPSGIQYGHEAATAYRDFQFPQAP